MSYMLMAALVHHNARKSPAVRTLRIFIIIAVFYCHDCYMHCNEECRHIICKCKKIPRHKMSFIDHPWLIISVVSVCLSDDSFRTP